MNLIAYGLIINKLKHKNKREKSLLLYVLAFSYDYIPVELFSYLVNIKLFFTFCRLSLFLCNFELNKMYFNLISCVILNHLI